ncbi:hypothetical protein FPANT_11394 [Fusarium pseudoanthophilum]|uniref:Uncharacterized protein n=1 Tax=Fusarium pseudoanthophilum TaxID=48495 RepID=A0A8H5KJB9_9HYPO|nr:hypothetical protein FPANT_11394 [Fusarium pseudoanthophilum]
MYNVEWHNQWIPPPAASTSEPGAPDPTVSESSSTQLPERAKISTSTQSESPPGSGAQDATPHPSPTQPKNLPANEFTTHLTKKMSVAVGPTTVDALLAYLKAHQNSELEKDIRLLGHLLRTQDDSARGQQAGSDEVQNYNFARSTGGRQYMLPIDPKNPAQPPLQSDLENLKPLNQAQALHDAAPNSAQTKKFNLGCLPQKIQDTHLALVQEFLANAPSMASPAASLAGAAKQTTISPTPSASGPTPVLKTVSPAPAKEPTPTPGSTALPTYPPVYHDQGPETHPPADAPQRDLWNSTQPWFPLFIEWDVKYYHIDYSNWQPQDQAIHPDKCAEFHYGLAPTIKFDQSDKRTLSGRILLLPQPSFLLKVTSLPFAPAPLDGFMNHLVTLASGSHLKPNIRVPTPDGSGSTLEPLVEAWKTSEDIGLDQEQIEEIDNEQYFAQTVIPQASANVCDFMQVSPAINQPARLNASFVISDTSQTRAYWRPITEWENPVWGWLVVNYVDNGIQFFSSRGKFYSEGNQDSQDSQASQDSQSSGNGTASKQYTFPFKLGDTARPHDGLIGYFRAFDDPSRCPGQETDTSTLFTDFIKSNETNVLPISDPKSYPTLSPFWIDPKENVATSSSFEDIIGTASTYEGFKNNQLTSNVFGCIMDPFLPVNIYTSILPVQPLTLANWTWESALNTITAFFHFGPLMLTDDVPPTKAQSPAANKSTSADSVAAATPRDVAAPSILKGTTASTRTANNTLDTNAGPKATVVSGLADPSTNSASATSPTPTSVKLPSSKVAQWDWLW